MNINELTIYPPLRDNQRHDTVNSHIRFLNIIDTMHPIQLNIYIYFEGES